MRMAKRSKRFRTEEREMCEFMFKAELEQIAVRGFPTPNIQWSALLEPNKYDDEEFRRLEKRKDELNAELSKYEDRPNSPEAREALRELCQVEYQLSCFAALDPKVAIPEIPPSDDEDEYTRLKREFIETYNDLQGYVFAGVPHSPAATDKMQELNDIARQVRKLRPDDDLWKLVEGHKDEPTT